MRLALDETQRNINVTMTAQIIPIPLIDCISFSVTLLLLNVLFEWVAVFLKHSEGDCGILLVEN